MRRELTEAQREATKARREKFKAVVAKVAAMDEGERAALAAKMGAIVTCDGHALSLHNTLLLVSQCPAATVVGGFNQWKRQGRCVRKGEHGHMIWVPIARGKPNDLTYDANEPDAKPGFIPGTVFDIAQTDEEVRG